MHLQVDPHSGVPVYRQVMDQVKHAVAAGIAGAGHQLPSIRELAQNLHVNPTTIVKAYTELEHEGVIEMKHGKGAFVAEAGAGRRMSERDRDAVLRPLARRLAVEAAQVGASPGLVSRVVKEEMEALERVESHA